MQVVWDLESSLVRAGAHLCSADTDSDGLSLHQDTVEYQDQEDKGRGIDAGNSYEGER